MNIHEKEYEEKCKYKFFAPVLYPHQISSIDFMMKKENKNIKILLEIFINVIQNLNAYSMADLRVFSFTKLSSRTQLNFVWCNKCCKKIIVPVKFLILKNNKKRLKISISSATTITIKKFKFFFPVAIPSCDKFILSFNPKCFC